jgi:phosphatidylserine/phosphatidylglycerophosphate/cardiolipin synthase-like enzyme
MTGCKCALTDGPISASKKIKEKKEVSKTVKLLIQPGDGVDRLVKGIRKAKKSVEIVIFRFDRAEIERAFVEAVEKGVSVRALIAFTKAAASSICVSWRCDCSRTVSRWRALRVTWCAITAK